MTTTELIELLKSLEKGASGRSREISIVFESKNGKRKFIAEPEITFDGSGDGIAGAELTLSVKAT
jgi:hypothetical protein